MNMRIMVKDDSESPNMVENVLQGGGGPVLPSGPTSTFLHHSGTFHYIVIHDCSQLLFGTTTHKNQPLRD